ncbi:MAG: hypothetical protein AB7N80_07370 [Bdellovibrionales bacterium]
MVKILLLLSLFAAPLLAEEGKTFAPVTPDQALIEAVEKRLMEVTASWAELSEGERLTNALATIARLPELQNGLGLSYEALQWMKSGQTTITSEMRQQISALAVAEFAKQLKIYRDRRHQVRPGRSVEVKVGIELMKGITAMNVGMLSAWALASGIQLQPADMVVGLKVLGLLATIYAVYRPIEVVNILSRHGESEVARAEEVKKIIAASPIPEALWQSWILIQQFADEKTAQSCDQLLRAQLKG